MIEKETVLVAKHTLMGWGWVELGRIRLSKGEMYNILRVDKEG